MKLNMNKIAVLLASFFGLGFIPKAPGTFGSLAGLALAVFFRKVLMEQSGYSGMTYLLLAGAAGLLLIGLAILAISKVEKQWPHDDSRIVIDEVVGQFFVTVWFPATWVYILLSFILFRAFDIAKPGPIGWVDRKWHSGLGTLVDDLIAALFAFLILLAICVFLH